MIKKLINKENLKNLAKEGAQIGVDAVTESSKGFISSIFYKIIGIIIFIFVLTFGGCIGSQIIVDKFSSKSTEQSTTNTEVNK